MRTLLAHLRKEWRDHRALLIGIAVAVPFLLAAGCAASNELAYRLALALPSALAKSTGLTGPARPPEPVDSQARRGWTALACLASAEVFGDVPTPIQLRLELSKPEVWFAPAVVVIVGLWAILASVWVPRGAAAVALGILLLAALVALPGFVLAGHEW